MSIPVPSRPPGYQLGSSDASIQIEVFIDLECPFSKKAWTNMLALVEDEGHRLAVTAHPIVLADHRQSWDMTKALTAIAEHNALTAWKFITFLYRHQEQYDHEAFRDRTRQDLFQLIEKLVAEFDTNLPSSNLVKEIQADSGAIANQTKASIRYGMARGIWSTPTFIINGSPVPQLESSSTTQDWQDFLNAL